MQRYSTLRTCSPQNCQSHQKKSRTKKKEKLKSIKHTQKTIEKIIIETKAGFLKRINIIGKLLPLKKKKEERQKQTVCLFYIYLSYFAYCLSVICLELYYIIQLFLLTVSFLQKIFYIFYIVKFINLSLNLNFEP